MGFDSPFTDEVETRFIKKRDGIHCHVRIKFKPTSIIDRTAIMDQMTRVPDGQRSKADKIYGQALAESVKSWEFLDDDGNPFRDENGELRKMPDPTFGNIMQLKPELFARIGLIAFYGNDGGDTDPFDKETSTKPLNETIEGDQKN